MELKDWVGLVVPIISNGILIYLFQSYFNKKLEKTQRRSNQISAVVKEYQMIAEKISVLLQNFTYDVSETEQSNIMGQIFAIASKELFPYFDRHTNILEHFQNVNRNTLDCTNNLRNAFATQNRELAVQYLNELNKYLQKLSNECDEYILNRL